MVHEDLEFDAGLLAEYWFGGFDSFVEFARWHAVSLAVAVRRVRWLCLESDDQYCNIVAARAAELIATHTRHPINVATSASGDMYNNYTYFNDMYKETWGKDYNKNCIISKSASNNFSDNNNF